jgi:hypothetical protein
LFIETFLPPCGRNRSLKNGTFPKHRGHGNGLSGTGNHSYFLRNIVAGRGNTYNGQGNGLSGIGNHSNFLRNTVAGIGNIYDGQGNTGYGILHKASG